MSDNASDGIKSSVFIEPITNKQKSSQKEDPNNNSKFIVNELNQENSFRQQFDEEDEIIDNLHNMDQNEITRYLVSHIQISSKK